MGFYFETLMPVTFLIIGFVLGYLLKSKSLKNQSNYIESRFKNFVTESVDEKADFFSKISTERIASILNPLNQNIDQFKSLVDESFKYQGRDVMSLKGEIKNIISVNEKIITEASNLTSALKGDNKVQGEWGEIILEKILEKSGLREGEDYITQGKKMGLRHSETGGILKPDVIVKLPQSKYIVIDSKVNLKFYEEYVNDKDDVQKHIKLNNFLVTLKNQIKALEAKKYHEAYGISRSPDFVLMFIPIEGAYSLAIQSDKDIHSFAWDKKIAITCPSTLMIALKTISAFWKVDHQNKNALEIATQAGQMYDKFVLFSENMLGIRKGLEVAKDSYDKAFKQLTEGKGNLASRSQRLKSLGVKYTKDLNLDK